MSESKFLSGKLYKLRPGLAAIEESEDRVMFVEAKKIEPIIPEFVAEYIEKEINFEKGKRELTQADLAQIIYYNIVCSDSYAVEDGSSMPKEIHDYLQQGGGLFNFIQAVINGYEVKNG